MNTANAFTRRAFSPNSLALNSPSVSFSQLRLAALAQESQPEEQLQLQQHQHQHQRQLLALLTEQRGGYFDPIYTKRRKHPQTLAATKEEDELESLTKNSKNSNPETDKKKKYYIFRCCHHLMHNALDKSRITSIIGSKLSKHNTRSLATASTPLLKILVAYIVAIILCLNTNTAHWLGPMRTILPLMVLLHHPAHSMGTQCEMAIQLQIGTLVGAAIALLTVRIARITNATKQNYGGIFACFIFVVVFLGQLVRLSYTRSYYICINAGLSLMFVLLQLQRGDLETQKMDYLRLFRNYVVPFSIGNALSLVCCLVLWPEFDHKRLVVSLAAALNDIKQSILVTIESKKERLESLERNGDFKNDNNKDDIGEKKPFGSSIAQKMNLTLVSLSEDFREFANEIFKFSLFSEDDMIDIRNCINLMVSPLKAIPYPIQMFDGSYGHGRYRRDSVKGHIHSKIAKEYEQLDDNDNVKVSSSSESNHDSMELNYLNATLMPLNQMHASSALHSGQTTNGKSSGTATPRPAGCGPPLPLGINTIDLYTQVVQRQFMDPIVELLVAMVGCVEVAQVALLKFAKVKVTKPELEQNFGINGANAFFMEILKSDSLENEEFLLIKLEGLIFNLRQNLHRLDKAYRAFTKTEWFCNELLSKREISSVFLFLRYHRQVSKLLIVTASIILKLCSKNMHADHHEKNWWNQIFGPMNWRILWMRYPLKKAIRRLPKQCLKDRGKLAIFNYFQTRDSVEKSFEKIYNVNTSRNSAQDAVKINESLVPELLESTDAPNANRTVNKTEVIRAVNHADYNKHLFLNTSTPLSYQAWKLMKALTGSNSKNSFKHAFLIIFTALPGLLNHKWYVARHCYWCPVFIWLLYSSTGIFSFNKIGKRIAAVIVAAFWAWCCCQAVLLNNQRASVYVMLVFIVVYAIPSIIKYYYFPSEARCGFLGLSTFSVIIIDALISTGVENGSSNSSSTTTTTAIWDIVWPTAILIIIAIISSIFITILIWPFVARSQVTNAFARLLMNLSHSYQIVTDRYVYRDSNDNPTELTLQLSTIREIRLLQHLYAVKNIIDASVSEATIINISANINENIYNPNNGNHNNIGDSKNKNNAYFQTIFKLLESCSVILEKVIEARINAIQFNSWFKDGDYTVLRKLIPLRRDSVASIIFIMYVLANCFESESAVPCYLPNLVSVRKQLYDEIALLQQEFESQKKQSKMKRWLREQKDSNKQGQGQGQGKENALGGYKIVDKDKGVNNQLQGLQQALENINSPKSDAKTTVALNFGSDSAAAPTGIASDIAANDAMGHASGSKNGNENNNGDGNWKDNKYEEEVHWTEIHAIAFSKAITDIVMELERMTEYSKTILGEDAI